MCKKIPCNWLNETVYSFILKYCKSHFQNLKMKTSLFLKQALGTLLFFALIFLSAGKLIYWQGLVYLAIGLVMIILNFTVFSLDPELIKERAKAGEGAKSWDKQLLLLSFLLTLAMYVTGGLDSGRYGWSPEFHPVLYGLGILLTAAGQLLFLIAQKQNRFFSSTVRIQTDRGHTVCDTGLYKVVRHPAYMGSVIQAAGFPLLFGSLWSSIPVCLLIIVTAIRTKKEDSTLINELGGYKEYTAKTRYRLVPFVW
jgi:protein-S-isoprenylcysteine O-methyltransferase Ste14